LQQESEAPLCPKTKETSNLLNNHQALTIHAVAHWLEKIYDLDTTQFRNPKFDVNSRIANKDLEQISSSEDDLRSLAELFEFLRAGKVSEAQDSLM
jgi:hypothetical protein